MVLPKDRIDNAPEALVTLIDIYTDVKLLDRIGDLINSANLALFLLSDESSFTTGQVINSDGAMLAQNPTVNPVKNANLSL